MLLNWDWYCDLLNVQLDISNVSKKFEFTMLFTIAITKSEFINIDC